MKIKTSESDRPLEALCRISELNIPECSQILNSVRDLTDPYRVKERAKRQHEEFVSKYTDELQWDLTHVTEQYIKLLRGDIEIHKPYKPFSEVALKKDGVLDRTKLYVDFDKYILFRNCPHPIYEGIAYGGANNVWVVAGELEFFPVSPNNYYLKNVGKFWCSCCKSLKNTEDISMGGAECRECWEKDFKKCKVHKVTEQNRMKRKLARLKAIPFYTEQKSAASSLRKVIMEGRYTKNKIISSYFGTDILEFRENYIVQIKTKNWSIDHITPLCLQRELYKRGLYSIEQSERLVKALWHHSNIQVINRLENQEAKADVVDGVRIMNTEDCKLLKMAEMLIRDTEKVRKG